MMIAPAAVLAFLRTATKFSQADLYTVTLITGQVLTWTDAATSLTVGGTTFVAGPLLKRGAIKSSVGLSADDTTLEILGNSFQVSGIAVNLFALNGGFDGALVQLDRIVMPTYGDTSLGSYLRWRGRITQVEPSSSGVKFTVASDLQLLDIQMPRNIFQPTCNATLYDGACGINPATYRASGGIYGGTAYAVNTNIIAADSIYDLGVLTILDGPLAGVTRTIKASHASGAFDVWLSFPAIPTTGNIQVLPGCDKNLSTCSSKFSNTNRFRGFPYIPPPATAKL